jgi:hypothetical protein
MWTFTSHKSMDDQSFSIVLPPDLVKQWVAEVWPEGTPARLSLSDMHIAGQAATWAANQELEACCEWVGQWRGRWPDGTRPEGELRTARRRKPPSLKQQALNDLDTIQTHDIFGDQIIELSTIRRAIEALPNE